MLAAPASEFVDSGQEADGSRDSGEKFQFEHCIVLSLGVALSLPSTREYHGSGRESSVIM